MSYKVEVLVKGEPNWHSNQMRFKTKDEAEEYADLLWQRWTLVEKTHVVEVDDPIEEAV